jgi:hypothetical protein
MQVWWEHEKHTDRELECWIMYKMSDLSETNNQIKNNKNYLKLE